jgi:hypothetical protein
MQKWLDRLDGPSTLALDALPNGDRKEMLAMTPADQDRTEGRKRDRGPQLVPVTFAATLTEAEFLKSFLEEQDIPALVESEHSEVGGIPSMTRGIPILVPSNRLEEAAELVQSHQRKGGSSVDQDEDEDLDEEDEDDFDDEDEEDLDEDLDEDEDFLDEEDDDEDVLDDDDD